MDCSSVAWVGIELRTLHPKGSRTSPLLSRRYLYKLLNCPAFRLLATCPFARRKRAQANTTQRTPEGFAKKHATPDWRAHETSQG